ncbi:DNA repair helicase XPB [Ferroacidibacillus organovorans]|uniref:DNA 3'-5' helicase n=1 Tax=Ferroacidibacillus organovorans TaxID=1765683 RepID=A0A117SX74_9BACL|nr:DNA repair helicase XPB [Ferroacidibacillus organovorans]KUO94970.1 helicase [Ferroacidibacillus organovorans]
MDKPVIVQMDGSILLDVHHPDADEARQCLVPFAELEKSPDHFHTYRVTALSLWNAASAGHRSVEIVESLRSISRYDVPPPILRFITETMDRYGILELHRDEHGLTLFSHDPLALLEVCQHRSIAPFVRRHISASAVEIPLLARGTIKVALTKLGYPVRDLAGYAKGQPLHFSLREFLDDGAPFILRDYQEKAAASFHEGGNLSGGSGVLTLPCGAGKTIIGLRAMELLQTSTLILAANVTAARQWIHECLDKTTLAPEQVAEYSGESKMTAPVTVATYQILSFRPRGKDEFPHLSLLSSHNWGLIIYDEVHLLPAPVFRITAEIQARRRLGLTATLVREDGKEDEVFSLIGPKKFDAPWKELEAQGYIATATCTEVRVGLNDEERRHYAVAELREKARIAAEAQEKEDAVLLLVARHSKDMILIIGQYIDQLKRIAEKLHAPLITGSTKSRERDELYQAFRTGELRVLVVSKVANFSIDLPDASVAIQVSGAFGSRQEEAQRLGRIMRPKAEGMTAHFYSVVTRETKDQEFALGRQRFLTEQGYQYEIVDLADLKEVYA